MNKICLFNIKYFNIDGMYLIRIEILNYCKNTNLIMSLLRSLIKYCILYKKFQRQKNVCYLNLQVFKESIEISNYLAQIVLKFRKLYV